MRGKGLFITIIVAVGVTVLFLCFFVTRDSNNNVTIDDTRNNNRSVALAQPDMVAGSSLSVNGDDELDFSIPAFLENRFDYGTYEQPMRLADPGNYGFIELTERNTLDIPEFSVMCVLTHRDGEMYSELYPQDNDQIKRMFGFLENTEFSRVEDERGHDPEMDTMVEAVLLLSNGKYALLHIRSYMDDYIQIEVAQETRLVDDAQFGGVLYGGYSAELHKSLRTIMGIKECSKDIIKDADSIRYMTVDSRGYQRSDAKEIKWLSLSSDKISRLAELVSDATLEHNYAYGCSYNSIIIEAGGVEYRGAYTTDSCGMIIIEDKTYLVPAELNDKYTKSIFVEEVFTEGWEDWLKRWP